MHKALNGLASSMHCKCKAKKEISWQEVNFVMSNARPCVQYCPSMRYWLLIACFGTFFRKWVFQNHAIFGSSLFYCEHQV